jgi:hypothetical protein
MTHIIKQVILNMIELIVFLVLLFVLVIFWSDLHGFYRF